MMIHRRCLLPPCCGIDTIPEECKETDSLSTNIQLFWLKSNLVVMKPQFTERSNHSGMSKVAQSCAEFPGKAQHVKTRLGKVAQCCAEFPAGKPNMTFF